MRKMRKSCYLIGEDFLVIQCGDILISQGYFIEGLLSPLPEAHKWAIDNGINYYDTYHEFEIKLLEKGCDYLFSIANSQIISLSILSKVKQLSINYHDAPLPRYGGAHATEFAILNNEDYHGVTWHVINSKIDGGDILKQIIFPVDRDETTLSLNIKCYQHGLHLFDELIKQINIGSFQLTPQNLYKRSYHNRKKKPQNNGFIIWNIDAESLERSFRAFNIGSYDNKFSVLKFELGGILYVLDELKITSLKSNFLPGTIVNISEYEWQISTITHDITILKIVELDGSACSLLSLSDKYNLSIGQVLPSPTNHELALFTKLSEDIFQHESFWVYQYKKFQAAEFAFLQSVHVINNAIKLSEISKINMSDEILLKLHLEIGEHTEIEHIILTVWLIYLYRLGNKNNTGIGLTLLNRYHENSFEFSKFFSNKIPFLVKFNDDMNFKKAVSEVKNFIEITKNKQFYLKDILFRYKDLVCEQLSPQISVVIGEDCEELFCEKYLQSPLVLKIISGGKKIIWSGDQCLIENIPHLCQATKNVPGHIATLVESILSDKNLKIKKMEYLTSDEHRLFLQWNNTKKYYPKEKFIHQIFEDRVKATPNNIAIEYNETQLTYNQLNKKAIKLAHYLTNNFVITNQFIPVYLDPSVELIIVILGILKAGGVYIPIATSSPMKHLVSIILCSSPPFIVSKKSWVETINSATLEYNVKIKVLLLEENLSIDTLPTHNLNIKNKQNTLAYVIYTSGTTGHPKGVMIKHESLVNLILDTVCKLAITPTSRILQFASIGFDASIWEIFSALVGGGTLCIPSQDQKLVGKLLKKIIDYYRISLIILPPSALQTLSQYKINTLKTIVTGGEFCSKELASHWIRGVNLFNAYGPTEVTVCATMAALEHELPSNPPIGKLMANTIAYVLDKNCSLLPIGAIGELYLGGDGVGSGYLNQDELTQRFFIQNYFVKDSAQKLYRTRDLVRWLPNGELEYVGRLDNQVKIRGYRIELEAIEAQILHYHDIHQCAVTLQENKALGKFLVAYVASPHTNIDVDALRIQLKKTLPDYMIPSFFIYSKNLLLTASGKIDREKLKKFDSTQIINLKSYTPPCTEVEHRLVSIWSELLSVNPIGIHDDFFNLGGHSLILTNLSIKLMDELNYVLSLQQFFKLPTIAYLANLISNQKSSKSSANRNHLLLQDKILAPSIQPLSGIKHKERKFILLTGASGFLGVHLLYELYRMTNATIYCLIRCNSISEAFRKLENELDKYRLNITSMERIIPICGDLSKAQLGLSKVDYKDMSEKIDAIYHNGAYVNHLYSYERLRLSNVNSTVELLKLATVNKNKELHYVSTLSAGNGNRQHEITEKFCDIDKNFSQDLSGYNQTKLVAECLLSQAHARSIYVNIYRPGWILGQSLSGLMPTENNHLLLLLKGCIQLGYAPDFEMILNVLPVDFISKFIVSSSLDRQINSKIYNITHNDLSFSWKQLIDFSHNYGYEMQMISADLWREKILGINNENALYRLLALYRNSNDLIYKIQPTHRKIINFNMLDAMITMSLELPIDKEEFLNTLFNFFERTGFLVKKYLSSNTAEQKKSKTESIISLPCDCEY